MASYPDLFVNAYWILTFTPQTDPGVFESLHTLVTALGEIPLAMSADEHEQHLALLNHLPHLLANTLMLMADNYSGML